MKRLRNEQAPIHHTEIDWMPFPGGELEGKRPRVLCSDCRSRVPRAADGRGVAPRPALCFQCYRAELERARALKAAGELDTASEARFQSALPFEPVNSTRLARLRIERQASQAEARIGTGAYVEKRRRAQIEARHALARVFQGLKARRLTATGEHQGREAALDGATHAAELQLPESWLPFVVSQ